MEQGYQKLLCHLSSAAVVGRAAAALCTLRALGIVRKGVKPFGLVQSLALRMILLHGGCELALPCLLKVWLKRTSAAKVCNLRLGLFEHGFHGLLQLHFPPWWHTRILVQRPLLHRLVEAL